MEVLIIAKPEVLSECFNMIEPKDVHSYTIMPLDAVSGLYQESSIKFSLVIAVGGDGTMLTACRYAAYQKIPVIGLNKGNLGFLAVHAVTPGEPHPISRIMQNISNYVESIRYLVQVQEDCASVSTAFNEFTISPPFSDKMLTYDLYIGNEREVVYTGQHKANGVIVASPSGSTAYSLSCGGSLVDPNGTQSLQIIPVAPFSMTSRPIIVSNQQGKMAKARIVVKASVNSPIEVKSDGQPSMIITCNKAIDFVIGPCVSVLHPVDISWYSLLATKLNWNQASGRIN